LIKTIDINFDRNSFNCPRSYYKVVVFIDPLQGLNTIFIIAILYLFYRYGYDI